MKKILVIENNKNILEELTIILLFEDFMVYPTLNTYQGFQMLEEELPELVLVNIDIAKADGLNISEQLNSYSKINIPFIYYFADENMDLSIEKIYLTDNLSKPPIPLFLTDYIHSVINYENQSKKLVTA